MEDKKFKSEWIRQCLFEYIGLHLDDMGDYLGFVVMIAQWVQVYYKIGGEWTLIREIKGQKII